MPVNFECAKRLAKFLGEPSPLPWDKVLELTPDMSDYEVIKRATVMACGQFNYWEEDGEVKWPGPSSEDWTAVTLGKKPIEEMNLVETRRDIRERTLGFIEAFTDDGAIEGAIHDSRWWDCLTHVFGGDPLRKRETLLWMMLDYIGYVAPCPQKACVDYNLIVALRRYQVVCGYEGNRFDLYGETCLRRDCLEAVEWMYYTFEGTFTVASLDAALYLEGRRIRREEDDWEDYFCYRPGCYFY